MLKLKKQYTSLFLFNKINCVSFLWWRWKQQTPQDGATVTLSNFIFILFLFDFPKKNSNWTRFPLQVIIQSVFTRQQENILKIVQYQKETWKMYWKINYKTKENKKQEKCWLTYLTMPREHRRKTSPLRSFEFFGWKATNWLESKFRKRFPPKKCQRWKTLTKKTFLTKENWTKMCYQNTSPLKNNSIFSFIDKKI